MGVGIDRFLSPRSPSLFFFSFFLFVSQTARRARGANEPPTFGTPLGQPTPLCPFPLPFPVQTVQGQFSSAYAVARPVPQAGQGKDCRNNKMPFGPHHSAIKSPCLPHTLDLFLPLPDQQNQKILILDAITFVFYNLVILFVSLTH